MVAIAHIVAHSRHTWSAVAGTARGRVAVLVGGRSRGIEPTTERTTIGLGMRRVQRVCVVCVACRVTRASRRAELTARTGRVVALTQLLQLYATVSSV